MTKDNIRCIKYINCLVIAFALIWAGIIVNDSMDSVLDDMEKTEYMCYYIVGKDNITYETYEDWLHHAYVNDTLVCAHGVINPSGLKEIIVYRPFPSIKVVNAT